MKCAGCSRERPAAQRDERRSTHLETSTAYTIPIGTNFLIFGLVGWSWVDIDTEFRLRDFDGETVFHNSDSFNANGVTFGGGVEWKFTDNLSIRGEYRFTDLDKFDNNGRFDCEVCEGDSFRSRNEIDLDVQRVLFTLNWRFGGFGSTTAAAY